MFRKKICRLMIALLFACALVPNILSCAADSNDSENTDANTDSQTTGSITGLSISKNPDTASIASDGSITLTASAEVSGTTAINYTWTISDTDSASLSADSGTSVKLTGKNNTEENKSVTVTLTATDSSGNKKTASTVITVSAKTAEETKSLNGVSISGTTEIGASATGTLTATPSYTGDIASEITYTWEISPASDYATVSGSGSDATITGKNTTETEQSVTVKVTATYGTTSKDAAATVKIAGAGQTVTNGFTGLALVPSDSSVAPDGTVTITPTVTYTGSLSESDFTVSEWQITEGGEYATLKVPSTGSARASLELTGDNRSILQAKNTTTSSQTVTVSVKVSCGGVEKTEKCSVTVEPSKVTSVSISGANSISCSGTTNLTAVVAKTGNPASITYKWEIPEGEGGEYAEITGEATSETVTVTGKNTSASAHNVKVKVTVSDGTNSVSNTIDVTVEKDYSAVSALFPENGATGAYADTQLVLTFSSTPTLVSGKSVKIYTSTGVLVDTIDILPTSDDSQIPQSGSSYTTNVGNQQLVRVKGNSVYIQPHYNGSTSTTKLSYDTAYYVEISADAITVDGTLTDGSAWSGFSGSDGWSFTTKSSPSLSTSSPITVSNDIESTDADFFSVYGALFALAQKSSGDYEIDVAATGNPYYELISINNGGANVTVKGMGTASYGSDVVLEYVNNVYMNNSTHYRTNFYFKGSGNLTLENITIKNLTERGVSYTADGSCASSEFQAEAFTYSGSANVAAYNCSFISKQDTILLNSGRGWFYKCHVEGDVDFIWGSASAALFEECEIESILTEKSSYLTETRVGTVGASTVGKGYVFLNSTIKGNGGSNATYLSRLASSNAKSSPSKTTYDQVAFINSTFDSSAKVSSDLWLATDAKYPRFIEKDSSGNVNVGWKTYGNTGITPVTTEYAGEITDALYAIEYNGRYAILNRLYNVDFSAYQTVASASVWDLTSLESEFGAGTDSSKNNAFTEPDTSASTTIKWDFTTLADSDAVQGTTTTVAATTGTGTLYIDATSGKFDLRGTDAQFNSGTIAYIPASVGDTISVTLYSGTYTLGSTTASGKTTEITVTASDLTTYNGVSCVALTATGNEYLYNITLEPGEDSGDSGDSGNTGNTIPGSWTWTAADSGDGITTDNTAISDGTELGYVTISGTGATWRVSGSAVYCVQTGKTTNGCLKFTTSETATITIVAASTGSSNKSDAILSTSADTSGAIAESDGVTTVTGSNPQTTLTYNNVPAGTYYFGAFPASTNGRGTRVYSITVTSGTTSLSSVTISGNSSVKVGSQITLTATPNVSTTSAYTWTVTNGTGSASGSSTTNTLTLTGVTVGDVSVTASVDGVTSSAFTVTVKEAGSTPTISLTDTPTGYAAEGSPSWNTDTSKIVTVTNAKDLKKYASQGGYVIYVDGMIDMTTDDGTASMLPTSASDDNANLGNFIANHYGNWSGTKYTSWSAWRTAYAAANSSTSDWDSSSSKNADSMDGYEYQLYNDYKNQIMIKPASNTTIIGKTSESGIKGGSFYIEGSSSTEKKNIQIRNLIIRDAFDPFPHHEASSSGSSDGWNAQYDGITLKGTNVSNIWIDHCTFEDTISVGWNGFATVAVSDKEETDNHKNMWQTYDGMLDIAGTVENVTISYCKFVNHDKVMLLGNGSSDTGTKTITVHHCYFKDSVQRLPMVRYANVHLYNNYYTFSKSEGYTSTSTVNVRDSAKVNSEYNYFDFTGDLQYSYSDGGNSTGSLYYANDYGVASSNISLSSMGSKASTSTFVFTIPYSYTPDSASDVPTEVTENAGAGAWSVEE